MDLGLQGRVALITGGSTNIGAATAVAFGREGARVALTYRSRGEAAEKVARAVKEAGGRAMALPYDLADDASARRTVDAVLDRWGTLDVLVNNAASWEGPPPGPHSPPFEDGTDWEPVLDANLTGHLRLLHHALPRLRRSSAGRVVNVSSIVAARGAHGTTVLAAAKAGLHGATRSLAWELGPDGVLVNVVMPGLVLDGKDEAERAGLPPQLLQEVLRELPTGRLPLARHVADTVVFLCSSANGAITGEVVRVTGGA
ncbi:SDR family NAD(P)-dependent oxidoreductase [Streptomyces sp. NPDC059037]|uniref:SDR family NAD(P)-dependent oxidoreductase n=1 Tax=Streptomyces sp. NPDC059037 TaxID=3346710 RepID=UPI0036A3866A